MYIGRPIENLIVSMTGINHLIIKTNNIRKREEKIIMKATTAIK